MGKMEHKQFINRIYLTGCLLLFFSVIGYAEITLEVFGRESGQKLESIQDDGFTWLYPDIMAGSQLVIIISSDTSSSNWYGELYISDPYRQYGQLENSTVLQAAGSGAWTDGFQDSNESGFFFIGGSNMIAGDWFATDYTATEQGDCIIAFRNGDVSMTEPVSCISFNHVRTRDFNDDGIVNLQDFAILASKWQTQCNDVGDCENVDLDDSQSVDFADIELMKHFWLHNTR